MKQDNLSSNNLESKQRDRSDRRQQPFKSFLYSLNKGERIKARREVEIKQGYYTDRYEKWVGYCVMSIALLSMTDAYLTLKILSKGGTEANPFMASLLAISTDIFFLTKMGVTVICLAFALIHINFHIFNKISMKFLLLGVLACYSLLIIYEIFLLTL